MDRDREQRRDARVAMAVVMIAVWAVAIVLVVLAANGRISWTGTGWAVGIAVAPLTGLLVRAARRRWQQRSAHRVEERDPEL